MTGHSTKLREVRRQRAADLSPPPASEVPEQRHALAPVGEKGRLHFPTLDTLRFLAFFGVFVNHSLLVILAKLQTMAPFDRAPFPLPRLASAFGFCLDVFLVLSSFLITRLLLAERDATGTVRIGQFYIRRMLRIWPLYVVFLGAMYVLSVSGRGAAGYHPVGNGYWLSFLGLVGNWYTGLHGYPTGNILPLWSISLEEQFYIFWPVVLLLSRRRLAWVAGAMIGVALVARIAVAGLGPPFPAMWVFTITRLDPLAIGVILAVAHHRNRLPRLTAGWQWGLLVGGVVAWMAIEVVSPLEASGYAAATLSYPLGALAAGGVLVAALGATGSLRRVLTTRWGDHLGRRSYGLYVMHFAGLAAGAVLLQRLLGGHETAAMLLFPFVGFAITWVAAEASYKWLEMPFLRLKDRLHGGRRKAHSRHA